MGGVASKLPFSTEIWQKLAIPLDPAEASQRAEAFEHTLAALDPGTARPDVILLDTEVGGQSGGTGQTFPWQQLAAFARRHPVACAGGLNPGTVAAAIAALHPSIVDCSSGIERNLENKPTSWMLLQNSPKIKQLRKPNSEEINDDT